MGTRIHTVTTDGRVQFSDQDEIAGMLAGDDLAVVKIVCRGRIEITSLEKWAQRTNRTRAEAKTYIDDRVAGKVEPDKFPDVYVSEVTKKSGRGRPTYRVSLPGAAIWALFEQGEGPLATKFERKSAQVLARTTERGIHIITHAAFPYRDGDH